MGNNIRQTERETIQDRQGNNTRVGNNIRQTERETIQDRQRVKQTRQRVKQYNTEWETI